MLAVHHGLHYHGAQVGQARDCEEPAPAAPKVCGEQGEVAQRGSPHGAGHKDGRHGRDGELVVGEVAQVALQDPQEEHAGGRGEAAQGEEV